MELYKRFGWLSCNVYRYLLYDDAQRSKNCILCKYEIIASFHICVEG